MLVAKRYNRTIWRCLQVYKQQISFDQTRVDLDIIPVGGKETMARLFLEQSLQLLFMTTEIAFTAVLSLQTGEIPHRAIAGHRSRWRSRDN